MTQPNLERLLRYAGDGGTNTSDRCLDDETVAALAEGTLDAHLRSAAMLHLTTCARCRIAVASVGRALSDPAVAREVPTRARWSALRVAIPAAAAAIVLLVAMPWAGDDGDPVHRAPTITAVSSPALISPVGIVAEAETLRWTSVGGADRYRATLFSAAGAVLYEIETADTVLALPDSLRLTSDESYLWKVEARTGWGRWSASELVEFSIR